MLKEFLDYIVNFYRQDLPKINSLYNRLIAKTGSGISDMSLLYSFFIEEVHVSLSAITDSGIDHNIALLTTKSNLFPLRYKSGNWLYSSSNMAVIGLHFQGKSKILLPAFFSGVSVFFMLSLLLFTTARKLYFRVN